MARRTNPSGPPRRSRAGCFLLLLVLLFLALVGVVFRRPLLVAAGRWLVTDDRLEKCDAAVVLSGEDGDGRRTREAVTLYKNGWVRKIVLSGTLGPFSHYETNFSLPLAVSLGVARDDLVVITHQGRSTKEEAAVLLPPMEKSGIRSIILVTSNYHTARARRIFLQVCRGRLRVLAHPASNQWFQPDSWWQSREGRKVFLLESAKRLNSFLE